MSDRPMKRRAAIDDSMPDVADLQADLDVVREALDQLLRKAETAGMSRHRRFLRYLRTIDRMHREVGQLLDQTGESERESVDDAAEGLKEVWARLAIARSAARARFH